MDKELFLSLAQNVIVELEEKFSTHDFIKKFMKLHECAYILWLNDILINKAIKCGIFQEVHRQIGKYLAEHANVLHIHQIMADFESVDCFGDKDKISLWHKKLSL